MTDAVLHQTFAELCKEHVPLPGGGETPARLQKLFELGARDLTLAKLVEAHWDAVAILAEAGRTPANGATYAVWASEIPGREAKLYEVDGGFQLAGEKLFASGAGIVDRALITVNASPSLLVEVDLRAAADTVKFDPAHWHTEAFRQTRTAAVNFFETPVEAIVGGPGWYANRAGLWHGGIGVAACWAGGASALLEFALSSTRNDAHTLAHLGAMHAQMWAMRTLLETAGREIDAAPVDTEAATVRALTVRALVEQGCAEILTRMGRAYGPYPMAVQASTARRMRELELYIRQCHAERDLEALGRALRALRSR